MVVGDRLWLFSQPVNGPPAAMQSLLLNNVSPAPQHYPSVASHSSLSLPSSSRNFSANIHNDLSMIPQSRQNLEYESMQGYLGKNSRPEYYGKFSNVNRSKTLTLFSDNRLITTQESEDSALQRSNGLADLESKFGQNSRLFGSENNRIHETFTSDVKSSSSSDVDCEEIDINDEN